MSAKHVRALALTALLVASTGCCRFCDRWCGTNGHHACQPVCCQPVCCSPTGAGPAVNQVGFPAQTGQVQGCVPCR